MGSITNAELGEIEALYKQYEVWCKLNGLLAEFGVEFFDWLEGAGNVAV